MLRKNVRRGLSLIPASYRHELFRSQLNVKIDIPSNLTYHVARTIEDLEAAFAILHDAYVDSGFMQPHPSGLRVTKYHALPSTTTLVAKLDGKVVATLSLIRDSHFGLPMDASFNLEDVRRDPRRLMEISSLAVSKELRGNHGEVLLPLLQYMWTYATHYFGVERAVIAVNPRRVDFFEGILLFQKIAPQVVDSYSFVNGAPAVGLYIDGKIARSTYAIRYYNKPVEKNLFKYMIEVTESGAPDVVNFKFPDRSIKTISDPVMTPELLEYFFKERTQTFAELNPIEIQVLHQLYQGLPHQKALPGLDEKVTHLKARRQRRHEVAFAGEILLDSGDRIPVTVQCVSFGGVRILTDREIPAPAGDNLKLRIATTGFDIAQAEISLAWQTSAKKYGFRIQKADHQFIRTIEDLDLRLEVNSDQIHDIEASQSETRASRKLKDRAL